MNYQKLQIKDYVLSVHLGITEQERVIPQEVRLTIDILFLEPVGSCVTDSIENTVCYDKLTTEIRTYIGTNHYKTIEYLSKKIFDLTKKQIPQSNKTLIHIHKVNPPMPHIVGGTHFTYGDA